MLFTASTGPVGNVPWWMLWNLGWLAVLALSGRPLLAVAYAAGWLLGLFGIVLLFLA